jgi:N-acetylglucosamine malate deacetylase 1
MLFITKRSSAAAVCQWQHNSCIGKRHFMTHVLVVVAHPDDEVLGCGGTLAHFGLRGDNVHTLIVADGETGYLHRDAEAVAERRQMAIKAAACLNLRPPMFLDLADQRLDAISLIDLIQSIEKVAAEIDPEVVLTHDRTDLNRDHRVVFEATATAIRPLPGRHCRRFLTFETPGSTEYGGMHLGEIFLPNVFVDISEVIERKIAALNCYAREIRSPPHPRSLERIEALARWRGAWCGRELVEAFRLAFSISVAGDL